ncbi:MAG: hypothetical protein ACOX8R_00080 [Bacillota bacterium]
MAEKPFRGGDGTERLFSAVWFVSAVGAELRDDELEQWADYCSLLSHCFHYLACFRRG